MTAHATRTWFICQRCNHCCTWPGFVRIAPSEIARISAFLALDEREFINRYTALRPSRSGLMLEVHADGACVFHDGAGCAIYPVRPRVCREFPNGWNFPGWRKLCHAVQTAG